MSEKLCEEVIGSASGEMFYKCVSEFSGFAHWSGPFFSGLFIGIGLMAIVAAIVGSQ